MFSEDRSYFVSVTVVGWPNDNTSHPWGFTTDRQFDVIEIKRITEPALMDRCRPEVDPSEPDWLRSTSTMPLRVLE